VTPEKYQHFKDNLISWSQYLPVQDEDGLYYLTHKVTGLVGNTKLYPAKGYRTYVGAQRMLQSLYYGIYPTCTPNEFRAKRAKLRRDERKRKKLERLNDTTG